MLMMIVDEYSALHYRPRVEFEAFIVLDLYIKVE